jgi:hypothetical protein
MRAASQLCFILGRKEAVEREEERILTLRYGEDVFLLFTLPVFHVNVRLRGSEMRGIGRLAIEPRRHHIQFTPVQCLDKVRLRAALIPNSGSQLFCPLFNQFGLQTGDTFPLEAHPGRIISHSDPQFTVAHPMQSADAVTREGVTATDQNGGEKDETPE